MAKGNNKDALYRVAKFQIRPSAEQAAVLRNISTNLTDVWNTALQTREENFEMHIAPLYAQLAEASKKKDSQLISEIKKVLKKVFSDHQITLFDQINALTPQRASDEAFAATPRNWQEETLDTLNGSFLSFAKLRQNGDSDARPPKMRKKERLPEISGRYGFKIRDGNFILSLKKVAGDLEFIFPIPEHQLGQIAQGEVKKFTLYIDKKSRYQVSLAYKMPAPERKAFDPDTAVYIALGTFSIGIISPKGQETLALGRADWHWMEPIHSVTDRLKQKTSTNPNGGGANIHALKPGSRAWKKRNAAKRKMFGIMSQQQQHDRRNLVARDLLEKEISGKMFGHGIHFVVSDLVVRSKRGKLADAKKPERGGVHGQNFATQNTGALAFLVAWLEEKAKEVGGSVKKHKLPIELVPHHAGKGPENKIAMALALRASFLKSLQD